MRRNAFAALGAKDETTLHDPRDHQDPRGLLPKGCGAAIDRIQFFDAETGWAAGEQLEPLPQDPFLLLTTDGGKSWRRRPMIRVCN